MRKRKLKPWVKLTLDTLGGLVLLFLVLSFLAAIVLAVMIPVAYWLMILFFG